MSIALSYVIVQFSRYVQWSVRLLPMGSGIHPSQGKERELRRGLLLTRKFFRKWLALRLLRLRKSLARNEKDIMMPSELPSPHNVHDAQMRSFVHNEPVDKPEPRVV